MGGKKSNMPLVQDWDFKLVPEAQLPVEIGDPDVPEGQGRNTEREQKKWRKYEMIAILLIILIIHRLGELKSRRFSKFNIFRN